MADLQKIGVDSSYPLDGNYLLQNDLNLSTIDWTPIGGYYGEKGRVSGSGIFSGTFDGQGHVIEGLTIQKNNALSNASHYAFIGLFGVIASDNANEIGRAHV